MVKTIIAAIVITVTTNESEIKNINDISAHLLTFSFCATKANTTKRITIRATIINGKYIWKNVWRWWDSLVIGFLCCKFWDIWSDDMDVF